MKFFFVFVLTKIPQKASSYGNFSILKIILEWQNGKKNELYSDCIPTFFLLSASFGYLPVPGGTICDNF